MGPVSYSAVVSAPQNNPERNRFGRVGRVPTPTPASSPLGWQDAVERGFERASQTLRNIVRLEIIDERARVDAGKIIEYLVTLKVIFTLEGASD